MTSTSACTDCTVISAGGSSGGGEGVASGIGGSRSAAAVLRFLAGRPLVGVGATLLRGIVKVIDYADD